MIGSACILSAGLVFAGDLTPPAGPVTATMKTLNEVEPRIPVGPLTTPGDGTRTYIISQPGSYYLTENLIGQSGKHGIEITANNVTLDLMGHTLDGANFGFVGILGAGSNVTVRNGVIADWLSHGLDMNLAGSLLVESVTASGNNGWGMRCGQNGRFVNCAAESNTLQGFVVYTNSMAIGCTSRNNTGSGFTSGASSVISECRAQGNTGSGFELGGYSSVSNCQSTDNTLDGFLTGTGSSVVNCVAYANDDDGFQLGVGALIRDSVAYANGDDGIDLLTGASAIECISRGNSGIGVSGAVGATMIDCTASGNGEHGVEAGSRSLVRGGAYYANGTLITDGCGVYVNGTDARIENTHATSNDYGVRSVVTGALMVGNSASGNSILDIDTLGAINGPLMTGDPTDQAWGNFDY